MKLQNTILPSFVSLSVSQSSASNSSVTAIGATKLTFPSIFLLFDTKEETVFVDDFLLCSELNFGELFIELSLLTVTLESSITRISFSIKLFSDSRGELDGEVPEDLRSKYDSYFTFTETVFQIERL